MKYFLKHSLNYSLIFLITITLINLMGCKKPSQRELEQRFASNQNLMESGSTENGQLIDSIEDELMDSDSVLIQPSLSLAEQNLANAQDFVATTEDYVNQKISATEFKAKMENILSPDVKFWSDYRPTSKLMRPFFAERSGLTEVMKRYRGLNKYQLTKEGSTTPSDYSVSENTVYFTQEPVVKFYKKKPVKYKQLNKLTFSEGKIVNIELFVEALPIERVYRATKR